MTSYTNRQGYIDKLLYYKDEDLIKVVSGLRRSGKSTLLYLYCAQLLELKIESNQIQFYNFELPENFVNKNWYDIYLEIKEKLIVNQINYVFLDEVQNIPLFEKLVDGLLSKIFTHNRLVYTK